MHSDTPVTAADFRFSDVPPAEVKAPLNIKHLSEGKHITNSKCFIKRQERGTTRTKTNFRR